MSEATLVKVYGDGQTRICGGATGSHATGRRPGQDPEVIAYACTIEYKMYRSRMTGSSMPDVTSTNVTRSRRNSMEW